MGCIISLSTTRNVIYYLLVTCLLLLPVTYFLAKSNRISFFPSYLVGLSVLGLIGTREFKAVFERSRTTLILILSFLAYSALTALWSNDPGLKPLALYAGYGLLILTFVFGIAMAELRFGWFRDVFLLLLVLSATVSACYSMYLFQIIQFDPLVDDRLYSLGGLHNPVVGALSYGAAFVLMMSYLPTTKETLLRVVLVLLMVILFAGIINTGTRSVWIGLIAAFICLVYLLPAANLKLKLGLGIGGILFAILSFAIILELGLDEKLLARSTSFRPEIWQNLMSKMMSAKLMLGYGINSSAEIHHVQYVFDHPHSIYLSTLFYGGVVGLVLFLSVISRVLYLQLTKPQASSIYIVTLLVFGLVCLIFDGNRLVRKIDFVWLLIWLPIAFSLSVECKENDKTCPRAD